MSLTIEAAEDIVALCLDRANTLGKSVGIVVVDREGDVLISRRPHTLRPLILQLATAKAYTAAVMERPTRVLETWEHGGPNLYPLLSQLAGRTMMVGFGGVTIARDGTALGGLGVSGAKGEEDQQICDEVLAALGYQTNFLMDF